MKISDEVYKKCKSPEAQAMLDMIEITIASMGHNEKMNALATKHKPTEDMTAADAVTTNAALLDDMIEIHRETLKRLEEIRDRG